MAVLAAAMLVAATTGCEWLKGRPDVDRVDVTVAPDTIAEGEAAQAVGQPKKGDGSIIGSSKVRVRFSTSDASVATVNPENGTVVGIAPGTASIFAESQGKRGSATVTVVFAPPATIVAVPDVLTPVLGTPATLTVEPRRANGTPLPGRTASFASLNPLVATVNQTGPLTATVNGIAIGTTEISVSVGPTQRRVVVSVRPRPIATLTAQLQNGTSSVQVGEPMQINLTARDSTGATVVTAGRDIRFESSDQTVATVSTSGVVTGVRVGQADIRVNVDGVPLATLRVTIVPRRVTVLTFGISTATFRVGGGVRNLSATAFDSAGQRVTDRQISYTSTNPNVATVTATTGLVTPRAIGTTRIVAALESLADTLTVQVTEVPIASVRVDPPQQTATTGETRQYTVAVFDSLGRQVTGRTVSWQTSNPGVATVDQNGLATAGQVGTAQIQALVDAVPGFPQRIGGSADLIVRPTPIARVEVTPATATVRVGQRTFVTIRTFDAAGRELFGRSGSIVAVPADPSIVGADQGGGLTGLKAGTTTVTYQAVDPTTGLAQGAPATISVTVSS